MNRKPTVFAQGDILLIRRDAGGGAVVQRTQTQAEGAPRGSDRGEANRRDGADPVILAEGEVTGHHHALYGGAVLFRDDALARAVPSDLYIGSLKIEGGQACLTHPEHDTITLDPGHYEVRRQREYHAGEARRVQD
ncbi:MAG: hypothetical protein LCH61_09640 [Proteobacteria bacterium]|nr:hypothetical protein [Pseudomonadota bacterium]